MIAHLAAPEAEWPIHCVKCGHPGLTVTRYESGAVIRCAEWSRCGWAAYYQRIEAVPVKTMPVQKPGRSKQEYGTPPDFWLAVLAKLEIEVFDCDLAADAENAIAIPFITREVDAFSLPTWDYGNGWNWLNPPFGKIAPWVERAYLEAHRTGVRTAVLVPAGTGANWWRDFVHHKACVLLLNGRITFIGCDDPYPKDCALLLYGHEPGYHIWSWQA